MAEQLAQIVDESPDAIIRVSTDLNIETRGALPGGSDPRIQERDYHFMNGCAVPPRLP